ncbi:hypothetical protein ruthe_00901 [Rubellimicrobium thermophilum DSM 16684]|uniref:Uncharacterized protein n=1 Tax=Rubellimicrobium thermophilum DSM 16684 TaxID=1123069 RepID=S9R2D8_9RHOB|nr:hypothetical protein ruthe_00901 [Rubellimicrobium thermophilum DSM 16684]
MNAIMNHSRGLGLLMKLNGDLVLYGLTVLFALCAGIYVGTLGMSMG